MLVFKVFKLFACVACLGWLMPTSASKEEERVLGGKKSGSARETDIFDTTPRSSGKKSAGGKKNASASPSASPSANPTRSVFPSASPSVSNAPSPVPCPYDTCCGTLDSPINTTPNISHDVDSPDAIFGTGGNAGGDWTQDQRNGLTLSIRAKKRFTTPFSNAGTTGVQGGGFFTQPAGNELDATNSGEPLRPLWNFDWSVAVDEASDLAIGCFQYEIGIDIDPTPDTNFGIIQDVIPNPICGSTVVLDHSFGISTTANNMGVEAGDLADFRALVNGLPVANFPDGVSIAQNSWTTSFFPAQTDGFDPDVAGVYNVYIAAKCGTEEIARAEMFVTVVVPTP